MAKILIVPHAPAAKIRTRAGEIAKKLAEGGHEVDVYSIELQEKGLGIGRKLAWHLSTTVFGYKKSRHDAGYNQLRLPYLTRGPEGLRNIFVFLNRELVERQNYDMVINAAYGDFLPPRSARVVYDLVDDHSTGLQVSGDRAGARKAKKYMAEQIARADAVTCSSLTLLRFARENYGVQALYIPNGADLARIRGASGETVPYRVGFMGGLDPWVDMTGLINEMEKVRRKYPRAELHILGKGAACEGIAYPDWAVRHGFVDPEKVPEIVRTFHIGVLPFKRSPFTDVALPLKVIEYGAARKPTVATPLLELQEQNLPWVRLTEMEAFARAIENAFESPWLEEWDRKVDEFDWSRAAGRFPELLGRDGRART